MGKIVDLLSKISKKENPYKDLSTEDLEKKKADLKKQREYFGDTTMMAERGYSRGYDGRVASRQHEDVYMIQIKSIDREINRIEAELRKRKEQESSGIQPGIE